MRLLLVDGFPNNKSESMVPSCTETLASLGHTVETLTLRDTGFATFMSEAERRAYHDADDNLITDAQRTSVDLVRSTEGILIYCPIEMGGVPPIVKSWLERTFVPGVAFVVKESGRLQSGMRNLRRVAMLTECPAPGDRSIHGRDGCAPATLRALRLTAALRCRSRYGSIKPGGDVDGEVARLVKGWPSGSTKSAGARR